jgi:hypothetical protein
MQINNSLPSYYTGALTTPSRIPVESMPLGLASREMNSGRQETHGKEAPRIEHRRNTDLRHKF